MKSASLVFISSWMTILGGTISSSSLVDETLLCNERFVYVLVNPTSGGNKASHFTEPGLNYMHFNADGVGIHVFIGDIRGGNPGDKPFIYELKRDLIEQRCITAAQPARVIVAGGDGTVVWAMSEAISHGVDITKVAFGVLPYGTGNDFASYFGWGKRNPSNVFDLALGSLRSFLGRWLRAEVVPFDLWDVDIEVKEGGLISKWSNGKVAPIVTLGTDLEDPQPTQSLRKHMTNYFSIGVESAIGLEFEQYRQKSQTINKAMYMLQGSRFLLSSLQRIPDVLKVCKVNEESLFTTDKTSRNNNVLKGSPVSLVFLNIDSFAGGCSIWGMARGHGLECTKKDSPQFTESSPSDGMLDILSYATLTDFASEQAKIKPMAGKGQRISQSKGPFDLEFQDAIHGAVHMEIDGEFFRIVAPKRVRIAWQHQVRVLKEATADE